MWNISKVNFSSVSIGNFEHVIAKDLKEMDFKEVILFLMELFGAILIFIFFISVFKWLLMLTILITECSL